MSRGEESSADRCRTSESGFTFIELVITLTIVVVIMLAATTMVSTGTANYGWVVDQSRLYDDARSAVDRVAGDLRNANAPAMLIEKLSDGNCRVTLRTAVGGNNGSVLWGAHGSALGKSNTERSKLGYSVRYTVISARDADGRAQRSLVRQVLDDHSSVVSQEILARGLRGGDADRPGFSVEQIGKIWRVTLSLIPNSNADGDVQFSEDVFPWNSGS